MANLLGAFGSFCTQSKQAQLAKVAAQFSTNTDAVTIIEENLFLFAAPDNDADTIITLDNNQGILVGKLFDRSTYQKACLSSQVAEKLVRNPKALLTDFWGRYVGAFYNRQNNTATLVRDPQGLSTLFYVLQSDGVIFANKLSLLYDALSNKRSIDFSYIAEYLLDENHALPTTPFKDIFELLPGIGLTIHRDGSATEQLLWDFERLKPTLITKVSDFEEELLGTLQACVKAWVADSTGVCIELSGGLDSSSVMVLTRSVLPDTKIIGINYIDSTTSSSNEIEHAQEVAQACDASLLFVDSKDYRLVDRLPSSLRPDKPNIFLLNSCMDQAIYDLANAAGCPVIMNGQGGDHVFLSPPPHNALADYWLEQGLKGSLGTLHTLSSTYRTSWGTLLYNNLKSLTPWQRSKKILPIINKPIVNPELIKNLKSHTYYLHKTVRDFSPAKALQVQLIAHAISQAEREQRVYPTVTTHPLLSQPIVELALKIPTYQSFGNGFDRVFLRRAVNRIKPLQALWRRHKGHTTGTMLKHLEQEHAVISELIRNGHCMKNNILDKQLVEKYLITVRHGTTDGIFPLLRIITAELWFNQWQI
jgi:asparagine synthase (glutamine-hydrolysing)